MAHGQQRIFGLGRGRGGTDNAFNDAADLAVKPVTTTRSLSAVLSADPHLFFEAEEASVYRVQLSGRLVAPAPCDFAWGFDIPVGAQLFVFDLVNGVQATEGGSTITTIGGNGGYFSLDGYLVTDADGGAGTNGLVQFLWAQAISTADEVALCSGSYLLYERVAVNDF